MCAAGGEAFDLYGAVCHSGSVSAGHYTAYARHPTHGKWNYFNDAQVGGGEDRRLGVQVEPRLPEGEGQDDVYVLFFKRSGLSHSVSYRPVEEQEQGSKGDEQEVEQKVEHGTEEQEAMQGTNLDEEAGISGNTPKTPQCVDDNIAGA